MNFFDTHCHLEALDGCDQLPPCSGHYGFGGWWQRSADDSVRVVQHVLDKQPSSLSAVVSNCCDPNDFAWYEGLMAAWDSGEFRDKRLYWTVGIHPYGAELYESQINAGQEFNQRMLKLAAHPRCVGIGECGLDYCKAHESHEAQKRVFPQICRLAVRLKKTLILHLRDCARDALEILRANVPMDWPIHLHGYTGEAQHVQELLDLFSNLHVGICGAITIVGFHGCCNDCAPLWLPQCPSCSGHPEWVTRDLDALLRAIPLDRMLLETDAPYMAPLKFGNMPCQPWMVPAIAEHVADKRGLTPADVIKASNRNACRLYGLEEC